MLYAQPPWRQIREDLRAKIRAGIYPPGSQLPSARLLAHDTSHVTGALDSMIELGELVGRMGIGVLS
nr:GntR family transcriptional regulator [Micromonospora chersina]